MRQAKILFKNLEAGILTQHDDGSFTFRYSDSWMSDSSKPDISLTMPKSKREFHASHLLPFFFNMLPEGSNKQAVCRINRIDQTDYFSILLTTAKFDSIGAIRVLKVENA